MLQTVTTFLILFCLGLADLQRDTHLNLNKLELDQSFGTSKKITLTLKYLDLLTKIRNNVELYHNQDTATPNSDIIAYAGLDKIQPLSQRPYANLKNLLFIARPPPLAT